MASLQAAMLRDHYALVAKDLLGPLLAVLNVGRERCGDDLDNFLIVLVVALRTAEDKRITGMTLDQVLSGEIDTYPSLSTNVRSIAESTGIPKETVRRKVGHLVDSGWVHRQEHNLSLTPQASRMFTEVREQILQMAVRYHQTILQLERTAET